MIWLYEAEISMTVPTIATARKSARCGCAPSARNASSGPYDDDDRPSEPSPTHAKNATSASWWWTLRVAQVAGRADEGLRSAAA